METKVALTNQSEIPFPHICYNICNIYLYIYASKALSATKLNPEKNTSSKTNNRKGAATLSYPNLKSPAMERSRSTIQEIPKVSAPQTFFFGHRGLGDGYHLDLPPTQDASHHEDHYIFSRESKENLHL